MLGKISEFFFVAVSRIPVYKDKQLKLGRNM